jgi:hypothetical protein
LEIFFFKKKLVALQPFSIDCLEGIDSQELQLFYLTKINKQGSKKTDILTRRTKIKLTFVGYWQRVGGVFSIWNLFPLARIF